MGLTIVNRIWKNNWLQDQKTRFSARLIMFRESFVIVEIEINWQKMTKWLLKPICNHSLVQVNLLLIFDVSFSNRLSHWEKKLINIDLQIVFNVLIGHLNQLTMAYDMLKEIRTRIFRNLISIIGKTSMMRPEWFISRQMLKRG